MSLAHESVSVCPVMERSLSRVAWVVTSQIEVKESAT